MPFVLTTTEHADDDEVAAALAAIQLLLATETQPSAPEPRDGWHDSAKLAVQHLRPSRTAVAPRWHTIERLRRTIGGRYSARDF